MKYGINIEKRAKRLIKAKLKTTGASVRGALYWSAPTDFKMVSGDFIQGRVVFQLVEVAFLADANVYELRRGIASYSFGILSERLYGKEIVSLHRFPSREICIANLNQATFVAKSLVMADWFIDRNLLVGF